MRFVGSATHGSLRFCHTLHGLHCGLRHYTYRLDRCCRGRVATAVLPHTHTAVLPLRFTLLHFTRFYTPALLRLHAFGSRRLHVPVYLRYHIARLLPLRLRFYTVVIPFRLLRLRTGYALRAPFAFAVAVTAFRRTRARSFYLRLRFTVRLAAVYVCCTTVTHRIAGSRYMPFCGFCLALYARLHTYCRLVYVYTVGSGLPTPLRLFIPPPYPAHVRFTIHTFFRTLPLPRSGFYRIQRLRTHTLRIYGYLCYTVCRLRTDIYHLYLVPATRSVVYRLVTFGSGSTARVYLLRSLLLPLPAAFCTHVPAARSQFWFTTCWIAVQFLHLPACGYCLYQFTALFIWLRWLRCRLPFYIPFVPVAYLYCVLRISPHAFTVTHLVPTAHYRGSGCACPGLRAVLHTFTFYALRSRLPAAFPFSPHLPDSLLPRFWLFVRFCGLYAVGLRLGSVAGCTLPFTFLPRLHAAACSLLVRFDCSLTYRVTGLLPRSTLRAARALPPAFPVLPHTLGCTAPRLRLRVCSSTTAWFAAVVTRSAVRSSSA